MRPGAENTRGSLPKRAWNAARIARGVTVARLPRYARSCAASPPQTRGEREHALVRHQVRIVLEWEPASHDRLTAVDETGVLQSHLIARVPARSQQDARRDLR